MPTMTMKNTNSTGATLASALKRSPQGMRSPAGPIFGFQLTMILMTIM